MILLPFLPLLLATTSVGDAPSFAPEAGAAVQKTWTVENRLRSDEMFLGKLGEVMPLNALMTFDSVTSLIFVDDYQAVAQEHPAKLRRTITKAQRDVDVAFGIDGNMQPQKLAEKSDLEKTSVVYTRAGDEYGKHYDAREADELLLADLWEDADFRAFLPQEPVEKGAQWSLDPSLIIHAITPLGELRFEGDRKDDLMTKRMLSTGIGGNLHVIFGGELQGGTLTAHFDGVRSEEGSRFAVIRLVAKDIGIKYDHTERANEQRTKMELATETKYESATVAYSLEGLGSLLWDLEAGRFHSFDFDGAQSILNRVVSDLRGDKRENVMNIKGELKVEVTTRGVEAPQRPGPR